MRIPLGAAALLAAFNASAALIPTEPVAIGHEAQFVFDQALVDNHWAIKYKRQSVLRVTHAATKHPGNPVIQGDQPSYVTVMRDPDNGIFRLYYQANRPVPGASATAEEGKTEGRKFRTHIAYAESNDGIHWAKPHLNLFPWNKSTPNNLVIARRDRPEVETCAPALLELPERDRQGFRYWMLYRAKGRAREEAGIRAVASQDGIHWEEKDDHLLHPLHSDAPNTVVHDPIRDEYVLFCRAKDTYRAFGSEMIDTGASRRIARLASKNFLTGWDSAGPAQTILLPDERDHDTAFTFFYGMPVRRHAGVWFGFLEPFRMNDFIRSELATSRDGLHWQRFPGRDQLIELGPQGSWDDEMIFAAASWVEVGDEWWIYYSGWDGPHGITERTGAIGLARIRKEGFASLRGPQGGGVVVTRRLIWPGGPLLLNANCEGGELKVRVSDATRKPVEGFDYPQSEVFTGNAVRREIRWNNRSLDDLKGRELRLEFFLRDADLYTFTAGQ